MKTVSKKSLFELGGMAKINNFSYESSTLLATFDRRGQAVLHLPNQVSKGHLRANRNGSAGFHSLIVGSSLSGVSILLGWSERSRQRHQSASLDDHLLLDVGIDRSSARREASRPIWDI